MVKIFVGRLAESVDSKKLTELFSKYGEVIDCEVKKNFGFVHMADKNEAETAIKELDKSNVEGQAINVEFSKTKVASASKIFVGNLADNTASHELHKLFKQYGTVIECDVIKNFAFVHMSREPDAREAIKNLNNHDLNGKQIRVQMAKPKREGTAGQDVGFGAQGFDPPVPRRDPYYDDFDMGPRSRFPRGPLVGSPYDRPVRHDYPPRRGGIAGGVGGASYIRLLRAERAMLARRLREGYGDPYAGSAFAGGRMSRALDSSAYSDFAIDDYASLPLGDDLFGGALDRYGGPSTFRPY